jgi:tetratricopeptide (TPR) repeat protein
MSSRSRRTAILVAAAILVVAAATFFMMRRPHGGSGTIDRTAPIILISIDTLRSDHLSAYGDKAIHTPSIDALANDAILFERAYSHCPLTLVSHASIFTGLLPSQHGIYDNIGYALGAKTKTLAEVLKGSGYATGGAVSAIVLRGETGISRGFDFYDDDVEINAQSLSIGRSQRAGDATREIAQKWIEQQGTKPFFFFLHIYEPHTPYEPTYDADVEKADGVIGRFVAFLRERNLYDRATIILLSDHGEGLGDHGEDEHGVFLYREALQVPLLVKLPGSARGGTRVATPVQLIDVFPTLAAPFGQKVADAKGESLLDIASGTAKPQPIYSETHYPRLHFGWSELQSLISGGDHFIQAPKPELYDLAADPAEKDNQLTNRRRAYVAMRTAIAPFVKAAPAPSAVDPEQAQQLAALGYIGSTVSTADGAALPDAKDRIQSLRAYKDGLLAFQEQHYEQAVAMFTAILKENPNTIDIWSMQTKALEKLGRKAEAVEAAKSGLRISPTATNLAIAVANDSLDLGRLDDAEKHARLAMRDVPSQAHYVLAHVALQRKDFARATAEANAALASNRDRPASQMLLGEIALEQGQVENALARFDESLKLLQEKKHAPIARLNFFRGDCLARLGHFDEAENAFRAEIQQFPAEPRPYKNLILLYSMTGRSDVATQLIFELEKAAPTPPSYVAISEVLHTVGDDNGSRFWAVRGLQHFPNDPNLRQLAARHL